MKKNAFVRFYHRDAHYYVIMIISHNSSVPMIGRLELAIGTLRPLCHICVMGVAYKNLAVSVSCHEVRFLQRVSIASYAKRCISYDRFCLTV